MANILKKTSFGLIRTNPRLTTNIKLVADSNNKIYLESIDADPILSKSIYKGFEISSSGSYSFDVKRFYSQNGVSLPSDIAYKVFEEDAGLEIKNRYKNQYDFTYGYGFYPKNTKVHSEEYALFAPIWLEPDNIPERFVIFKMDGPVSINPSEKNHTELLDDSPELEKLISDPEFFFENYIKSSRIIKSFDLTEKTSLGKYIRNHVNNDLFPESSLYTSFEKGNQSYWNGISYKNGGFCSISNEIYKDYVLVDKTVTESDDFITDGFKRNFVICANILNLEFLFNDEEQEKYSFSRYFGLYMSEVELGKFILDNNRLYDDSNSEITQIPKSSSNDLGDPRNFNIKQIQMNTLGVKLYPKVKKLDNSNGIYSGRLLNFDELLNPRFGYVKDTKGTLYSISNDYKWGSIKNSSTILTGDGINNVFYLNENAINGSLEVLINDNFLENYNNQNYNLISNNVLFFTTVPTNGSKITINYQYEDTNYLRIKSKNIDLLNFTGLEAPFKYLEAKPTSKRGRPGFSFKVNTLPTTGDEIRIQYIDWNSTDIEFINNFTITGDTSIPQGYSNGTIFSVNGTLNDIAKAISSSINNIKNYLPNEETTIFESMYKDNEVFIYAKLQSENWNKLKISFFSDAFKFPFLITSDNNAKPEYKQLFYNSSPIKDPSIPNFSSYLISGWYLTSKFSGGNDNPESRAIIDREDLFEFSDPFDELFIKTKNGYETISDFGLYLDEPIFNDAGEILGFNNVEKYFIINLKNKKDSISFGSSSKISVSKLLKNSCGYLSIYPIKDFDFRFRSEEYNKNADSNTYKLLEWYKGTLNTQFAPIFDYSTLLTESKTYINQILGPTSSFVLNGEFQRLNGYTDAIEDITDTISNEYDRLKENEIPQLALSSRVVPFINKWVYDNDSYNVREVPYRLNSNPVFGFSNFSPAFEAVQRNPKFFTHEWYYLQKYPPYMSFDEKVNSFSYFDEDLQNIEMPDFPNPNLPKYQGINGPMSYQTDYEGIIQERERLVGGTGMDAGLYSINEDYFLSYFTRETVDGFPIKRDFKYSLFANGDLNKPAETFFRGIKVEIKDRTEFSRIDYNKNSLRYINNKKYNGYKFSAVLTYGSAGTQITVIKNDKFKAITLLIQANIDDSLTKYKDLGNNYFKFIDRSHLYVLNDILSYNNNELTTTDRILSGVIYNWLDEGDRFKVYFKPDSAGNIPQLSSEVTLNGSGVYNDIHVSLQLNQNSSYLYKFEGVSRVEDSFFYCSRIDGLPNITGAITPNGTNHLSKIQNVSWGITATQVFMIPFEENPIYKNGGDGGYLIIMDELSFSNIANRINSGDPEIKYINITNTGIIENNTFVIDLIKPDSPVTSTYLKSEPIRKSSSDLQVNERILGYTVTGLERVIVNNINRYRGNYNPKFVDIFNFIDVDDLKTEKLDFLNIQILTQIPNSNALDGFYKDENLGKIIELYSNKVNVENPNIILSNSNFKDVSSVYPLIGEIAIDYDNFFIFKSNWDANYYKKYNKSKNFNYIIGTKEPKEEKSFFGSKTISIPNEIRIEKFFGGIVEEPELIENFNSIDNTNFNVVKKIKESTGKTEMILDIYVTKALEDWFIDDGISKDFIRYINSDFSFGNYGLTDDIRTYIKENLYNRYNLKEIIFWEKTYKNTDENLIIDDVDISLHDYEKISKGYKISKDFKTITNVGGGLDFSLIYTLPKDRKTSISISIILEKK